MKIRNSVLLFVWCLFLFVIRGVVSIIMLIVGNFMFIKYLHEDGVAAYSVACYLFPLVFMFGNSIAQSSLPIVSYNYGQKNEERIRKAFRLTVGLAVVRHPMLHPLADDARR